MQYRGLLSSFNDLLLINDHMYDVSCRRLIKGFYASAKILSAIILLSEKLAQICP